MKPIKGQLELQGMRDPNQIVSVRPNGDIDVGTVNGEPTLTQQQFKEECDINNIMARYQNTGEFTHLTRKQGVYGDFSEIKDYQTMLQTVLEADAAFASLPAKMRLRFQNDPAQLLEFIQDPKNTEEAISLGLMEPKPQPAQKIQNDPNDPKKSAEPTKPILQDPPPCS